MTDLEELWDSYPDGEPPVADLLRTARAQARDRRRRYVVRPLLAGATVAVVAAAFVVGTRLDGVSGSGGAAESSAGGDAASQVRNVAFQASLKPADSCAQLLASYRKRALAQVGAYGFGGWGYDRRFAAPAAGVADRAASKSSSLDGVANDPSGTNVQEAGVDEPDRVKTNGSLLVRGGWHAIQVYDVTGHAVRLDAELRLPDISHPQLLISGTTVVAIGENTARDPASRDVTGTRVETISLADPKHPTITSQVRYSGMLDTARLQGSDVHLVLTDGLPTLPFVYPHDRHHQDLSNKQARAHNRGLVARTTLDDWLPRYDDGSGSRPLLDCDRVAMPPAGVALGTESVVGFDIATPTRPDAIGIAGTTSFSYESVDHLYLTTGASSDCLRCVHPLVAGESKSLYVGGQPGRTTIFQFDLSGTSAAHVATGTVDGSIADRWSMDEADGILRVAITRTAGKDPAEQQSSVVTMRPDGTRLVQVGRLDGLGVGETLTAARWFDDLAIVSTARRTDPLFTVDLTDPAHPKLLGALHIPGFSDYFHPIGNDQLLGIGENVTFARGREKQRSQVGLFDISDLTDVKRVAVDSLPPWTWPNAREDPHAFTWLPDRSVALTSFHTGDGGTVLGAYHVDGATLTQKLTALPGRRFALAVRTLELPSGKVVLMAGRHVSFLDL